MKLSSLVVAAATALEANAIRRAAPRARVVRTGIGLRELGGADLGPAVVSCGLAGGLEAGLATGTIVIPKRVATTDGSVRECDAELAGALASGAAGLGLTALRDDLLTSAALVHGQARAMWAQRGYAAADMETAFIQAERLACVRVILDTPQRELSDAWLHPTSALWQLRLWPQALWLARHGPACARLAARVLAASFD